MKGEPVKNRTKQSISVVALAAAMGIGLPAVAYASSPTTTTSSTTTTTTAAPSARFIAAQKALEEQLAGRVTRLQHLSADVTGATSLSASASTTLQARLATEESTINSLVAKVPTDTTMAQVNADRAAMLKDNRVYAVMSPQVFELIEASGVATEVTSMQANESTLETETASLVGMAGYQNALNHYNNYVARLSNWSSKIVSVEAVVLAQTPQGYPANARVFVNQNRQILDANIALAHAEYDASIIGLASGGYTGS